MSGNGWDNAPTIQGDWNGLNGNSAGAATEWNDTGSAANTNHNAQFDNNTGNANGDHGGPSYGGCFNCGDEGHNKADCPNPRVDRPFSGTCRVCEQEGHRASGCPNKPKFCKQCLQENDHITEECQNKKVVDDSAVPDVSEEEAWKMLSSASQDRDIDDFKEGVAAIAKAKGYEMSYLQLEQECRKRGFNFYLIALDKEVALGYFNVDLTKDVGKKFTLGIFRSAACPRPVLMKEWPKDAAENVERLADVGVPRERGVMICNNCGEIGHTRKGCSQESTAPEAIKIHCVLCDSDGHRMRDCPEERPQPRGPRTCKFCESEDHIAKDCPDAPKAECRNCYQLGHKASDCTNEKVFKCRNCDEIGHMSRECPSPKDWERHVCRHCGEKGHGSENRCNPEQKAAFQAAQAEKEAAEGSGNVGEYTTTTGGDAGASGGDSGWATTTANFDSSGTADWEKAAPAPVAAGGGW